MSWFPDYLATPGCPAVALETSWQAAGQYQTGGEETKHLNIVLKGNKVVICEYLQQDAVTLLVTIVPLSVRGSKYPICSTYLILLIIFPWN